MAGASGETPPGTEGAIGHREGASPPRWGATKRKETGRNEVEEDHGAKAEHSVDEPPEEKRSLLGV